MKRETCGTPAGRVVHRRFGEPSCQDCLDAAKNYMRAYRRRQGRQPVVRRIKHETYTELIASLSAMCCQGTECAHLLCPGLHLVLDELHARRIATQEVTQ